MQFDTSLTGKGDGVDLNQQSRQISVVEMVYSYRMEYVSKGAHIISCTIVSLID